MRISGLGASDTITKNHFFMLRLSFPSSKWEQCGKPDHKTLASSCSRSPFSLWIILAFGVYMRRWKRIQMILRVSCSWTTWICQGVSLSEVYFVTCCEDSEKPFLCMDKVSPWLSNNALLNRVEVVSYAQAVYADMLLGWLFLNHKLLWVIEFKQARHLWTVSSAIIFQGPKYCIKLWWLRPKPSL